MTLQLHKEVKGTVIVSMSDQAFSANPQVDLWQGERERERERERFYCTQRMYQLLFSVSVCSRLECQISCNEDAGLSHHNTRQLRKLSLYCRKCTPHVSWAMHPSCPGPCTLAVLGHPSCVRYFLAVSGTSMYIYVHKQERWNFVGGSNSIDHQACCDWGQRLVTQ